MPEKVDKRLALFSVISNKPLASLCFVLAAATVWWTAREGAIEKAAANANVGYIVIGFLGAILLAVLLPFWASVRGVDPRRRAVLVVDDLDRCHPDQMLEIIECLQLFLDDEEVKKRLKIIMLVEEDILRNAIRRKYHEVVKSDDDPHSGHQLIGDNLEKLFLVWLRLEPLADDELETMFEGVCKSLTREISNSGPNKPKPNPGPTGVQNLQPADSQPGPPKPLTPLVEEKKAKQSPDEFLTQEETAAITAMVKVIRERSGRKSWGPRAVRSFVFRYQLARKLLEHLQVNFDPFDLIEALLAASRVEPVDEDQYIDKTLLKIAKQVS